MVLAFEEFRIQTGEQMCPGRNLCQEAGEAAVGNEVAGGFAVLILCTQNGVALGRIRPPCCQVRPGQNTARCPATLICSEADPSSSRRKGSFLLSLRLKYEGAYSWKQGFSNLQLKVGWKTGKWLSKTYQGGLLFCFSLKSLLTLHDYCRHLSIQLPGGRVLVSQTQKCCDRGK